MPNDGQAAQSSTASRRVLVIGYGPSGITCVEELQRQGFDVTCIEARSQAGGIWNQEPEGPEALELDFDQDGRPVMSNASERAGRKSACLSSAMYDCLHTNLPNPLMAYRGHPFPTKLELFPSRAVVADYFVQVGKSREACVKFNTLVTKCRHSTDSAGRRWLVEYESLDSGARASDTFDFIAAASGHYSIPYVPYYPGLWLWKRGVSHGRSYRSPNAFKGQNVLVVGARASGYDITRDISRYLFETEGHQRKVYQSVREQANMFSRVSGPAASIVEVVPAIASFAEQTVTLTDGRVLDDVDVVMLTTGYLFSFPFLDMQDAPFKSHPLYTSPAVAAASAATQHHGNATYPAGGLAMHNLDCQDLFYYPDPTLAFPALHYQVVPMQLAQVQARYLAHVWSSEIEMDRLQPGLDGSSDEGWAPDGDVRKRLYLGGAGQFEYEDAMMKAMGEGGSPPDDEDIHPDGRFAFNPQWRRSLRTTANVLKRATLGY